MFIPQSYSIAFLLMLLSMICWGSWANTQKATGAWRFELFYWDYIWGIVLCAFVLGITAGRTDAQAPQSFFHNISSASLHSAGLAFAGGIIFNIANVLLVAAIAVAGMAVAFPIGIGLALVIGSALNYLIAPEGNAWLLFAGIALVVIAIIFDAAAYRRHRGGAGVTRAGIILSLSCGIGMGLFYPFVAKALTGERHLVPYTVAFVFALGALASNFPLNYFLMRKPIAGKPLRVGDYFASAGRFHLWGIVGGCIWGVGTVSNFVASYAQMVGPATSYALGQGATMISAIWGVFVWHEFRGASAGVRNLLILMFVFFLLGLLSVALAPVIK